MGTFPWLQVDLEYTIIFDNLLSFSSILDNNSLNSYEDGKFNYCMINSNWLSINFCKWRWFIFTSPVFKKFTLLA